MRDLVCTDCGGPIVAGQAHECTVRIPRPRSAASTSDSKKGRLAS